MARSGVMLTRIFLCCLLFKLSEGQELEVEDECTSPLGYTGVCKLVIQCAPAIRSINEDGFHKLRRCGFKGLSEIVCCVEGKGEAGIRDRFAPDAATEVNTISTPATPQRPPSNARPAQPPPGSPPLPTRPPPAPSKSQPAPPKGNSDSQGSSRRTTTTPLPLNEYEVFTLPPAPTHRTTVAYKKPVSTTTESQAVKGPNTQQRFPITNNNEEKVKRRAEIECEKVVNSLPPPLDSYILGGVEAESGEFPYHVLIGYKSLDEEPEKKDVIEFLCGGTLVSPRFVMSAGHCFTNVRSRQPVVVRVGVVNMAHVTNKNETDYEIDKLFIHPDYKRRPRELHNDIALIRLRKPVPMSDVVHPGCLMTKLEVPPTNLIVTGFGVVDFVSRKFSEVLLKASLNYVPNEECAKSFASVIKLEDNMLCAGDPQGMRDACQGDSGGPLQAITEKDGHYRIIGITSFGRQCGTTTPGVYTRVTSHLDWIESTVWGST